MKVFTPAGQFEREVDLPGVGMAAGFGGGRTDTETIDSFSSFATPSTVFRYDLATGRSTPFRLPKVRFDPADFEVRQAFFRSKDGMKVPMFGSHRK